MKTQSRLAAMKKSGVLGRSLGRALARSREAEPIELNIAQRRASCESAGISQRPSGLSVV